MRRPRKGLDSSFLHDERYGDAPPPSAAAGGPGAPVNFGGGAAVGWFPVLVHVPRADYTFDGFGPAEFVESARMGNVVCGRATQPGLDRLSELPSVEVELSREAGAWELDASIGAAGGADVVGGPGGEDGARCLVGVIDGGIDILHEAFLDEHGRSRIVRIWDQHAAHDPPNEYGYGRILDAEAIRKAVAEGDSAGLRREGNEAAHGTHVASIAAGRGLRRPGGSGDEFFGGVAPGAKLAVVLAKLVSLPGDPVSIGYSKAHVDALHFLGSVAEAEGLPVVVNLSAGMEAGAHDGTSTLEAAFDAFTSSGRAAGRAIVKSAGNSRGARRHAVVDLPSGGSKTLLLEEEPTALATRTRVEAWFSSADSVTARVRAAGQPAWGAVCSIDEPATEKGAAVGMSLDRFHADNGDSRLLVSLQHGTSYELRLEGTRVQGSGTVHLWAEGRHVFAKAATERETLTVPGTAQSVITVAACGRDDASVTDFSSTGPTRDQRRKPEIAAPGLDIVAAKAGTARQAWAMRGTSMAAPHVTGAIALLFSREAKANGRPPNAAQVRAALIATAKGMNGTWNPERGFGVLDIASFLASFC